MRKYIIATAMALLIVPGSVLASEPTTDISAQRFEIGPGGCGLGPNEALKTSEADRIAEGAVFARNCGLPA
jgi:hypothetical protein